VHKEHVLEGGREPGFSFKQDLLPKVEAALPVLPFDFGWRCLLEEKTDEPE
jgi:hypothetical protein